MCDDLTAERRGRRTTTTAGTGAGTGRTRTTAARLTAAAGGLRYLTGTDLGTRLPAAVDVEVRHFEHTGLQLRRQNDVVKPGLLVLVAVGGDRKSVVQGTFVLGSVNDGGLRIIKKKKKEQK